VGLERGPLSLLSKTEELLERKSSSSGLEIREYDHMDPSRWQRGTIYPQKLALTSLISGGRSVGYSLLADSGHGVLLYTCPLSVQHCRADHVCLILWRQLSHLNGRKLGRLHV
jgi:hypothetical protein